MFKDAKVGDKVWSFTDGWGEVTRIYDEDIYQIYVEFGRNRVAFAVDGKSVECHLYQTLFWDEVKFDIPKKPLPDLAIDTKVIVWVMEGYEKRKRYFKKFDKNGKIVCFSDGTTSWSSPKNKEVSWSYWELAE